MSAGETGPEKVARLEKENGRLRRTNSALMDRVERGLASGASAFGVFERALDLEKVVAQRTRDLAAAKELAEAQARTLQQQAIELEKARAATEEAMQRFKAASVKAEQATRYKSEFLANMSHEIRTPMTAVLGFADNLLDPDLTEAERIDAIHTIRRNGEHLLQIINDILDLSKIEAGKLDTERISCTSAEILDDVKTLMQDRANAKNLNLKVEYASPIPRRIMTDPTRLKQILVNLVGNAIKFTDQGAVRVVAGSSVDQSDRVTMVFEVIDTGIGMTEGQLAGLFRAFSQADTSTTRRYGGTGLGLAISKRLAEKLGGDITARSKMGQGSAFCLRVDAGALQAVGRLERPEECLAKKAVTQRPDQSSLKPLDCRILLAEDGADNQRLIAAVLRRAGAEVTIVENGQLAVDAVLDAAKGPDRFDVVLMDMQMPVMDGYQAATVLRERRAGVPVIALTAHAMDADREVCLRAGCDDFVSKPIDRRKLIETLHKHIHREVVTG